MARKVKRFLKIFSDIFQIFSNNNEKIFGVFGIVEELDLLQGRYEYTVASDVYTISVCQARFTCALRISFAHKRIGGMRALARAQYTRHTRYA